MKSRDSMVLYRSFYDAIKELPEKNQLEILKQIFEFGLDGIESELTGLSKTIWILIKPNLEANRTKWESGCKAKRKQNRSKAEAKPKQERSETEANVDVDVDVDENEDKDVNENEKLSSKPKAKKRKEKVQFIPPTIEQLREYFVERDFPIEMLDEVYDHYNNANWHKVNDMPVIDWKRTISTNWKRSFEACRQRKQRQTLNVNRGSSQLPVDPSQIVNYGKGNGNCLFDKISKKWYEPLHSGYPPKEIEDYAYLDQGNHSNYGEYVKWMLKNDKQPLPPEDTRYFPADFNFERFVSEQKAILAQSNQ